MGDESTSLTDVFDSYMEQFADTNFISPDDIFSTLEVLEGVSDEFTSKAAPFKSPFHAKEFDDHLPVSQKSNTLLKRKRSKLPQVEDGVSNSDGQQKVAHIAVERNRRKQMNEHLAVLRSLLPRSYVKRSDQASIIEVVVDYITELQQVLQSLEAKKQRKVYSDVLSPRPPLPISPRTPQSVSPYGHRLIMQQQPSSMANMTVLAPSPSSSSSNSDIVNELVANSKSSFADVEVKFSGSNLVLKTVSLRLPGQTTKIVSVLEDLSLEILQAGINTAADETMVNSFTIKIGIECRLSAEDLVQHIQQTFC
ncbi:transcription factor SPEECHLESS-like [Bidens hawaiensis]|uniref:transcription factor SPEECHLESS-like n=1 Tax=Bidens hawaiensis TaxID=980011 RepID=UPI00404AECEF